jgi:hypothetical protein
VIVWINGTFGAGKTTTATLLVDQLADGRLFDAEEVGYLLRRIGGMPQLGDFQHWPPWRAIVAETARQVLDYVGGTLVVPQTVLVQSYWTEIRDSLTAAGRAATPESPGPVAPRGAGRRARRRKDRAHGRFAARARARP